MLYTLSVVHSLGNVHYLLLLKCCVCVCESCDHVTVFTSNGFQRQNSLLNSTTLQMHLQGLRAILCSKAIRCIITVAS